MNSFTKTTLALIVALSTTSVRAAVPEIIFADNASTLITAPPGVTLNGKAPVGTQVELFYQPGGPSAPAPILSGNIVNYGAWESTIPTIDSNPVTTFLNNGVFNGGGQFTGPDVTNGMAAWFTVVAWSGGYADLQTAVEHGTYAGESGEFELITGGSGDPPQPSVLLTDKPPDPNFIAGTPFQGISLVGIPEPSAAALSCLGAAAMLFFRRRTRRAYQ